jgi:hypothetical protein
LDKNFRDVQPFPRFTKNAENNDSSRVVALTTSYGLWGFPEFIANGLQENVTTIIGAGKGPLFPPNAMLKAIRAGQNYDNVRVAIWEIPEYHLHNLQSWQFAQDENMPGEARAIHVEIDSGKGIEQVAEEGMVYRTKSRSSVLDLNFRKAIQCLRVVLDVFSFPGRVTIFGYQLRFNRSP